MIDREKVVKEYEDYVNSYISLTTSHDYEFEMHKAVLALLKEQEVRDATDIREIDGLWCDDITFCPEKCGWRKCPRNKVNIRDRTVPHSYFVETPLDCPKQIEEAR